MFETDPNQSAVLQRLGVEMMYMNVYECILYDMYCIIIYIYILYIYIVEPINNQDSMPVSHSILIIQACMV